MQVCKDWVNRVSSRCKTHLTVGSANLWAGDQAMEKASWALHSFLPDSGCTVTGHLVLSPPCFKKEGGFVSAHSLRVPLSCACDLICHGEEKGDNTGSFQHDGRAAGFLWDSK